MFWSQLLHPEKKAPSIGVWENQQQPIVQQPHSECNYLCKSEHWLPREKQMVSKSSIKGNGICNSCSPLVEYSSSARSRYIKYNFDKFDIIQLDSLSSEYASVSEMLQSLGWMSLVQRRSNSRLWLFYKIRFSKTCVKRPLKNRQNKALNDK